jgi:hypothetical protein
MSRRMLIAACKSRFRRFQLLPTSFMPDDRCICRSCSIFILIVYDPGARLPAVKHLVVVGCARMPRTFPPLSAAQWSVDACIIFRYIPSNSTEGSAQYPSPFSMLRNVPYDDGLVSGRCPQRVRCPLHAKSHAALFESGFLERDAVHDECGRKGNIQIREEIKMIGSLRAKR